MWRRASGVLAGVLAAVLAVLVIHDNERVQGIVVPMPDATDSFVPTVTAVGIAETGTVVTTATQPSQQPPPSPQQPPSPVRPQSSTTSRPTTAVGTTPAAGQPTPVVPSNAPGPVAPRFDPAASFRIVNVVNGLSLDSGGWVQAGTAMKIWAPSPSTNLQFQLVETGGGYYRMTNRTNGFAVDGRGATNAGAYVGQRRWDSSPSMQWLPTEVRPGLFTLTNRVTGLVLDGGGAWVQSGAPAKQWPADNSPNLLWRIETA